MRHLSISSQSSIERSMRQSQQEDPDALLKIELRIKERQQRTKDSQSSTVKRLAAHNEDCLRKLQQKQSDDAISLRSTIQNFLDHHQARRKADKKRQKLLFNQS